MERTCKVDPKHPLTILAQRARLVAGALVADDHEWCVSRLGEVYELEPHVVEEVKARLSDRVAAMRLLITTALLETLDPELTYLQEEVTSAFRESEAL